jgi:SMC interacting uncharacterized protein involved in chromosome segregation
MAEDPRLERMENKIDELTKLVTSTARIEERMITLFKRMETYEFRHDNLDSRIGDVEKTVTKTGVVDQVLEKGFWVVIGGGIAYVVKVFGE